MIVFYSNNKRKLQEGRFQEMKLMQLHSSSQLLVCSSPSLLDPSFHPSILDGNSAFTHVLVKEYTVGKYIQGKPITWVFFWQGTLKRSFQISTSKVKTKSY